MILLINYTNWRGETADRMIEPIVIDFGKNEFHPEEQYLLVAKDRQKNAIRSFAMKDMEIIASSMGKKEELFFAAIRNVIQKAKTDGVL